MPNPTSLTMQEDEMDYSVDDRPEDYVEWVDRTNTRLANTSTSGFAAPVVRSPMSQVEINQIIAARKEVEERRAKEKMANAGLRYDNGKPRFDLIPPEAMVALAAHYERGARKYADRNWEKGMDWGRCFGSLQRHAWAWAAGEDIDAETDTHHMVAVAWNAIALYTYAMRKIGNDDRVKLND